jgi:SPOR domain
LDDDLRFSVAVSHQKCRFGEEQHCCDVSRRLNMNGMQRCMIGSMGGLAAMLTKYLSQHHDKIANLIENGQSDKAYAIIAGLGIVSAILMFLGGLIGWASREDIPLKLVTLGVSAPALVTTWAVTNQPAREVLPPQSDQSSIFLDTPAQGIFISSAHAADLRLSFAPPILAASVFDGVKEVLGIDRIEPRYWVIVASKTSRNGAQAVADKINREDPSMRAFVGKRQPNNSYFPVIVGDFNETSAAEYLKQRALNLNSINEAYLSDFADRRP